MPRGAGRTASSHGRPPSAPMAFPCVMVLSAVRASSPVMGEGRMIGVRPRTAASPKGCPLGDGFLKSAAQRLFSSLGSGRKGG